MICLEKLLSKFSYYYYKDRVSVMNLKVEKVGDYYLIIDNLTKEGKVVVNNTVHQDLKSENNNNNNKLI